MQTMTHWAALWREVVEKRQAHRTRRAAETGGLDVWGDRAAEFDERVRRRWCQADSTRAFVRTLMDPAATFLDIGAGPGAWAIYLAPYVRQVTALDPSPGMLARLRANVAREGLENIVIVQDRWPEAEVPAHDFVFCSHAMYGVPDLEPFLRQMMASARRMCFFLLRAPAPDSLMAEAAQTIWGQPHDLPDFTLAYNVLLQMGVYANVLIEAGARWDPATSQTLAEAVGEMKHKLGVAPEDLAYDPYLEELAARRLIKRDDHYEWPGQMRSALMYWPVGDDTPVAWPEALVVHSRSEG
jgi:SAM-dependent methyltransferase